MRRRRPERPRRGAPAAARRLAERLSLGRRRALGALGAIPLALTLPAARGQAAGRAPQTLGYLPWWLAPGWKDLPWRKVERLVLFDAPVQRDGTLGREWDRSAQDLLGAALLDRVPVELALTLHDADAFDAVFLDRAARGRLLAAAMRWLDSPFAAGLHLDLEGYGPAAPPAVAAFRGWLGELHAGRAKHGKALSAFFPASDAFAPYDAAAAGTIDYWVAQVYDAHWKGSKATGPIVTRDPANLAGVPRALQRLDALGVPPRRVLLSVPLYGLQWRSAGDAPGAAALGEASLLTLSATPAALMPKDRLVAGDLARRHGLRRDREGTPYYAYRDGEQWVQGWFEDLQSLSGKLGEERALGYAGLAFFALGYDNGELMEPLVRWWRAAAR